MRADGLCVPATKRQAAYLRTDASQRLAFGLCKKYGIELPDGATPKDAWQALKEKTGKTAQSVYEHSGEKGSDRIRFGNTGPKKYAEKLAEAKKAQDPGDAWRVTGMSKQELAEWHPDAKFHVTDGGSTIAVDNGDIVGVCVGKNDGKKGLISGSTLLAHAVKNGGIKLDSYEGNHRFYTKNGFEPVSWCRWDPAFEDSAKEQGWDPKRDRRENIIFYRYVGKGNVKNTDLDTFINTTPASPDYDTAYSLRDAALKKKG